MKYVVDILWKHIQRQREDKRFEWVYQAVLAGRMTQDSLYTVIAKEDNISDEDLMERVNATMAKFSKKGGK